jgi:hypothetical protein
LIPLAETGTETGSTCEAAIAQLGGSGNGSDSDLSKAALARPADCGLRTADCAQMTRPATPPALGFE